MTLIGIIVILILVGFLLWLINTYIPMDLVIKRIINIVVIIIVCIWLLQVFGLINSVNNIKLK